MKKISLSLILVFIVLLYNSVLSNKYINPDNAGWTTIDSMPMTKIDDTHYSSSFISKLQKMSDTRWLSMVQNSPLRPNFFYLRYTSDAGNSWTNLIADTNSVTERTLAGRLFFITIGERIVIVGEANNVWIMNDINSPIRNFQIEDSFIDNLKGLNYKDGTLICMLFGDMFRSYDLGETWENVRLKYNGDLYGPHYAALRSGSKYFICSQLGFVQDKHYFISNDSAKSWEKLYLYKTDSDSIMYYFNFFDENIGYGLVNKQTAKYSSYYKHKLMKTTDGGRNWFKIYEDKDSTLGTTYDIKFNKSGNILYYSNRGIFYFENDKLISKTELTFGGIKPGDMILSGFITDNNQIVISAGNRVFKYDPLTSVEQNINNNISISPNPATDYIEISLSPAGGGRGWTPEIFSIFGEKISTPSDLSPALSEGDGVRKIDVSNLVPGMYFIKIGDKFEKFVKL